MAIIRKYNGVELSAPGSGDANNYTSLNITGTTAETVLSTVLVPGNTFKQYDIIDLESRLRKTGNGGLATIRIRVGTTVSTGATLLATYTSTSVLHTFIPIFRRFVIKNISTGTECMPATTSAPNDITQLLVINSNISVDWTVNQYIIVTGQLNSSADTMNCLYIILKHIDGSL